MSIDRLYIQFSKGEFTVSRSVLDEICRWKRYNQIFSVIPNCLLSADILASWPAKLTQSWQWTSWTPSWTRTRRTMVVMATYSFNKRMSLNLTVQQKGTVRSRLKYTKGTPLTSVQLMKCSDLSKFNRLGLLLMRYPKGNFQVKYFPRPTALTLCRCTSLCG